MATCEGCSNEAWCASQDIVQESQTFEVESFVPRLQEYVKSENPYVRTFVIGWIQMLSSVPDVNLLEHLPEFVGGLFDMLADNSKDIIQLSETTLQSFLQEIKDVGRTNYDKVMPILLTKTTSGSARVQFNALKYVPLCAALRTSVCLDAYCVGGCKS